MQLLVEETQNTENKAAQVRVTPKELAQATAAIEVRQNALAQHQAATIPIGEAVHQLSLETTPEEVLAEVQAQRARPQTATTPKLHPASRLMLTAVIAIQTAALALLGMMFVRADSSLVAARQQLAQQTAQIQMLTAAQNQNTAAVPVTRAAGIELLNSDKFRTLDIESGQTIPCKYAAIEKLAKQEQPTHVYTARNPTGRTWEVLREGDHFFVKCWTNNGECRKAYEWAGRRRLRDKRGRVRDNRRHCR